MSPQEQSLLVVENKCDLTEGAVEFSGESVSIVSNGADTVEEGVRVMNEGAGTDSIVFAKECVGISGEGAGVVNDSVGKKSAGASGDVVRISALKGEGLDALKKAIEGCSPAKSTAQAVVVTSERHYRAICSALESMEALLSSLDSGISGELVAEDLREAIADINSIFASTADAITPDEVLGEVFGSFCIGKVIPHRQITQSVRK